MYTEIQQISGGSMNYFPNSIGIYYQPGKKTEFIPTSYHIQKSNPGMVMTLALSPGNVCPRLAALFTITS